MAAKGVGMLEADPAALAVVFVFFLVFTLGFEKILHHITHALKKRKKLGMLAAVNNFTSEIMLLGLAILLLMVCEERIAQICHPIKPPSNPPSNKGLQPWLSRVTGTKGEKGCACCLAKTKYVSKCFLKNKGCPELKTMKEQCDVEGLFRGIDHVSKVLPTNYTKSTTDKQLNGTAGGGESASGKEKGRRRTRQLLADPEEPDLYSGEEESPECIGPMQERYAECGYKPGMAPWVTVKTLHQVHMLLFFLAITHITTGVLVMLISTTKLKYYARRGGMSGEDKLAATAIRAAQVDFDEKMTAGLLSFRSSVAPPHSGHKNSSSSADAAVKDRAATDGEMPSAFATAAAADGAAAAGAQQKDGEYVDVLEPWNGRPDPMRFIDWLVEVLVYVVRQVCLWNTVDKQEYSVLRACFYYTHTHTLAIAPGHDSHSHDDHLLEELQHTHTLAATLSMASAESMSGSDTHLRPENARGSYGPYLTEMVERDGSEVVGLGLPMWLFVIVFVLVSGVIGWSAWLFLIFAGLLLLFLNLVLLTTLRHMTKGGRVIRQEEAWYHWLHRKGFLLGSIKLTLFFFTFVISNAIFMAANFGPESCFFSRTGFQKNPVPWWIIMLIDICLLLNLGLFTLPLYSLTAHSLKADKALLQDIVRDRILQEAFAELKKSHHSTNKGGSGGNSRGGSGGGHGGVKGPQQQQQQPKRSLSRRLTWAWSVSSKGHSAKFQQADSRPLSDDKHFQRIQETLSV